MDITGPIYDYDRQEWTEIDTATDLQLGPYHFVTPGGVEYQLNPEDPTQYRNYVDPDTEAAMKDAGLL